MIAIITYDNPHKKTQDVIFRLLAKGIKNIHIVALPWINRKNFVPIFNHKPTNAIDISLTEFAKNLNLKLSIIEKEALVSFFSDNEFEFILIGGAGLLPTELVTQFKIINTHPGYLPIVKGLDAFKWAILNENPIGVSSHFISEETDAGILIDRKIVPVFQEDTYHNVAYRVYEMEVDMLLEAIELIKNNKALNIDLSNTEYIPTRRLPNYLEPKMMEKFEILKHKSPSAFKLNFEE